MTSSSSRWNRRAHMANDPVLRMLGLARRAGKLAYGDELVREVCFAHKARCVFLAGDAGASTAKKGAFYAEKANVPCVQLPHGKIELGTSVGKSGCAIVAVTDIGLASSAVEKLASGHEEYAETAKLLSEKNARIQSRKVSKNRRTRRKPRRKSRLNRKNVRKSARKRRRSAPSARRTAKNARIVRTASAPSAGRTARNARTVRTASAPSARRTASAPSVATAHGNRILQAKSAASATKRNERAKARIQ
ncbi:hypothetical protein DW766_07280 [Butyricicoccus sp. AM29-23AC]|nr:hypothetical protein DW766_07280 [Butyricicoccus sp. AM29-23AC]